MKKSFLPLLMCVLLLVGALPAAAESMTKQQFEVTSLGIIRGDQNGAYRWDDTVTRAEFASMVIRLCGYEETLETLGGGAYFSDVKLDAWYAPYVNAVVKLGLMSGAGGGAFRPDDAVAYEEAVKTLVVCLGYDVWAVERGGYPLGYCTTASSIGLLANVNSEGAFTRGSLANLIANALEIDMLQTMGSGAYEVKKGYTLRSRLVGGETEVGDVFEGKGIVTSDFYSYIDVPRASIRQNELQIDGTVYVLDQKDASEFLGLEVSFFGVVAEDGRKKITAIQPTKNNEVRKLWNQDIRSIRMSAVEYMEDGRSNQAPLDADVAVLRNGTLCDAINENTLLLEHGLLTLIDHDRDGKFDVMMIEDFVDVRVEKTVANGLRLSGAHRVNGANLIPVDQNDQSKKYRIQDSDGNAISLENVPENCIASVAVNQYANLYHIVISTNQVEGVIAEYDDETVTIDEKAYTYYLKNTSALKPGSMVTAYLSFRGEVVDLERGETVTSYGYVTKVRQEPGLGGCEVQLLLPGSLKEQQEDAEEESDDPNAKKIAVLTARNKAVATYRLSSSLRVAGEKMSASEAADSILERLVAFETNAAGEIRKITYPQKIGTALKKVYNTYERTFGKTSGGAFGVDENQTVVICVPKVDVGDPAPARQDYLVGVQMNHGQTYDIEGFDYNLDTYRADVVLIHAPMNAQNAVNVTRRDPIGMITKAGVILDAEGEESFQFSLMADGSEKLFPLSESVPDKELYSGFREGDLVQYSVDSAGGIDGMNLLKSYNDILVNEWTDENGENESFTGYIKNVTPHVVSERLNKYAYQVEVQQSMHSEWPDNTYYVVETGTPPIFIYDPEKHSVRAGTLDDLCGGYERISFDCAGMNVKAVVILDE